MAERDIAPVSGQSYVRWFVDYPSTHVKAGQTVEVTPATGYDFVSLQRDEALAEVERLREALERFVYEFENFARYSRSVAADAVGPNRLTWQERAEWADGNAQVARMVLDAA